MTSHALARRGLGDDRRLQLQGVVLGAGIPLLITGTGYWLRGWGGISVIATWGAVIGAIVGWRSAKRSVSTPTPLSTAIRLGLKAALFGALGVACLYAVVFAILTDSILGALLIGVMALLGGVVIGSIFSVPVALASMFLIRRTAGRHRYADAVAAVVIGACLVVGCLAAIDIAQGMPRYQAINASSEGHTITTQVGP